jgi:hypothetical protein
MDPAEREIALLEEQLDDATPSQRIEIHRAIRDIERECAEQERWREQGRDRGWR